MTGDMDQEAVEFNIENDKNSRINARKMIEKLWKNEVRG